MAKKKKDETPLNIEERELNKTQAEREDPADALKTMPISDEMQQTIVTRVMEDYELGIQAQADWKVTKEKELQHIHNEKPSVIEGLNKKAWMSDRNLGICSGILDIYQATLMATCYNPDTIHFTATEENDTDNRDNLEKFTKWMVGPAEINFEPEVDDFIHNRVAHGFSAFEVEWEIKYKWVNKRIPKYSKEGSGKRRRLIGYDTKPENRRFERGKIVNIDNIDDILLPSYGKNIQDLPFVIRVLHLYLADIKDMEKRKMIVALKDSQDKATKDKLSGAPDVAANNDSLGNQKLLLSGIMPTVDIEGRNFPLDVLRWFGELTIDGKTEKYRVLVEPTTRTFLSAKPVRALNRAGKVPIIGGPLRRIPGQIRGGSIVMLIAGIVNALNNNYNQTTDYQTVQNLPFGFASFEEGFTEALYDIEPGKVYDVEGNPAEKVYFPNLQRSLAWSYQDKQFLLEMLERLTGAASYFLTTKQPDTTATRDTIVEQKGETKFGIWVRRIQRDIAEAINLAVTMYQDWAPPKLGKRVLGNDGKQIIRNLSIDTLQGSYDATMAPDLTSGSKAYEKQVMLWAAREVNQSCAWMNPQINPRGNWLLWKDTMRKQGIENPEHYLPPMPKVAFDSDEDAKSEWTRFMQGETFSPPEGVTPAVVSHYMTHMKQKETDYHELDEEYRANFDQHLFETAVNYQKFMQQVASQQQEMMMASNMVKMLEGAGLKQGQGMTPALQNQPEIPVTGQPDPAMVSATGGPMRGGEQQ